MSNICEFVPGDNLGDYIEIEAIKTMPEGFVPNLHGNAWVPGGNAWVSGSAQVFGDAWVYDSPSTKGLPYVQRS
jgi:hypothetical protein